jgi:hypothetical protein
MEKSCLNCGVIFEKHYNAKFCSSKCKDAKWQSEHWDQVLKAGEKYRKSDKGQKNILSRREDDLERFKEWKKANPNNDKEYYETHKNTEKFKKRHNFHEANRRAAKLNATPKWLTTEQKQQIKNIYNDCPTGFHVDHIVPLQGQEVKGLHVPWNLQALPEKLNLIKGNKVI